MCTCNICKRASCALCQCCDQYLCRDHFVKHDDQVNSKLNPLVDQINELTDHLTDFDLNKLRNSPLKRLKKWRDDCHLTIENYYEQKCQEFHQFIERILTQQRGDIAEIRFQIRDLIDKQETTPDDIKSLISSVGILQEKMKEIDQMSIQIITNTYIINKDLVNFKQLKAPELNLLTLLPPNSILTRSDKSSTALASNDQYLLIHQNSNLCLIDGGLSIIKTKKLDL